ncbi:MAG: tyrosine-type recombinase/integrase [Acidobacteriota bacterium]|nr:tyrosine-type recombinase/integrase [Acidobacteriota bacterium]
MKKKHTIGRYVEPYFRDYLGGTKGLAENTQLAYRDALRLFFCFSSEKLGKSIDQLEVEDLDKDVVLAFLDHLEKVRENCTRTRNHRLSALQSFYRYLTTREPELIGLGERVHAIPQKRVVEKLMPYLDDQEIKALLHTVDPQSHLGKRDKACLYLLYNTGARAQEIADLKPEDLHLGELAKVTLMGKGHKQRSCPLWPDTVALLKEHLEQQAATTSETTALFLNHRGLPLTRFGIRNLVKKYSNLAEKDAPSIAGKAVSTHTIRHATAMMLLHSGQLITTIRDWLGHRSIQTTHCYARMDMEMKRKVLQQLQSPSDGTGEHGKPSWQNSSILQYLDNLTKGGVPKPVHLS